jgi:hypothetical protein
MRDYSRVTAISKQFRGREEVGFRFWMPSRVGLANIENTPELKGRRTDEEKEKL